MFGLLKIICYSNRSIGKAEHTSYWLSKRFSCYGILMLWFVASVSRADLTGAGDASIVAKLTSMLKVLNEELREVKKQVNIAEQLRNMESLKQVQSVADNGKELSNLFSEALETERLATEVQDEPDRGYDQAQGELDSYINAADRAQDSTGVNRAYRMSRVLSDLDRLSVLGTAQTKSTRHAATKGLSSADAARSTATSVGIMSQLLIQGEEQRKRLELQQTINDQSFESFNRGMFQSYGNMGRPAPQSTPSQ